MLTVEKTTDVRLEPCVATIGFFDGVHIGHRFLIEQVKREAAARGLRSTIITFAVHPRHVVHSDFIPELLTTTAEKVELLRRTGVDYCVVLDFDVSMANLSARQFMEQVLRERYNVECLLVGHDHRFGKGRSDTFDDYMRYGSELGLDVKRAQAFSLDGLPVSSSFIRTLLSSGDVDAANRCLGYTYAFSGVVVDGHKVGREIGFPTANIQTNDSFKLIPANGVYAVRVTMVDGSAHLGMLNIGYRPTVNNGGERSIEVHILGFSANIYGETISISFLTRMRGETKFSNISALVSQLRSDAETVTVMFGENR
jgi:riboflavin kinase/FMN adenylyltransferase